MLADPLVLEVDAVARDRGGVVDEGVAHRGGQILGDDVAARPVGGGVLAPGSGAQLEAAGGGHRLTQAEHDHRRLVPRPRPVQRDLPDVEGEARGLGAPLGLGEVLGGADPVGRRLQAGAAPQRDGDRGVDVERTAQGRLGRRRAHGAREQGEDEAEAAREGHAPLYARHGSGRKYQGFRANARLPRGGSRRFSGVVAKIVRGTAAESGNGGPTPARRRAVLGDMC
ncbi:hypothetical protein OV079_45345 [Nannocystis pusilla]|uniref:Uncharacterized protein n=1 Tax=Nannocystis pusilla TaxID=889268 RepID=A0A9X3J408_9BACT|nr:hypothetical protein [Nannocystis pusilla]MCY1012643.1 hypothetical protein [Nannocystis pusilla]